ncbi:uncharacterized protein [Coffea arabica]|uniref:Uncharacterized protein n=1 Tax=Coffea arabica TaxID=13443 RepID=A0ABM4V8V4_COFAR
MEGRKKQAQLQAMWFAAGTAAIMACLERAVLVSVVEQWRVVAFLALNLLLLAILFTSPSPLASSNEPSSQEFNENMDSKVELRSNERKESASRGPMLSAADDHHDHDDGSGNHLRLLKCRIRREKGRVVEKQNLKDTMDQAHDELSQEELNERVEAFITMFRQHLVSDAKGKSCRVHSSSIKRKAMYNNYSGSTGRGF